MPQDLWDGVQAQIAGNRKDRQSGIRSAARSLLKGLLFDDAGNRMSPSHAVKKGRRYRYYVSQAVLQHRAREGGSIVRVPAQEIERLVIGQVPSLLARPERLIQMLAIESDDGVLRQALTRACRRLVHEVDSQPAEACVSVICAALTRVSFGEAGLEIVLSKKVLLQRLLGRSDHPGLKVSADLDAGAAHEDHVVLCVPTSLKRRSSASALILPQGGEFTDMQANAALVNAVARGHVWAQKVITGEVRSLKALSELAGLSERYVSRIVRLGFLAPERVRAILEGRLRRQVLSSLWDPPLAWR